VKLAAIDIGTNSVHMIVVRVRPDFSFEMIDREKEMVCLGAGGLDGRALTEGAIHAALQALTKFKRLADSYGVDDIVAAATSATREAENGGDFLDAVARQTGIRARVITGPEEARLIHLAAAYGIDLGNRAGIAIDIGGGSTEITFGPSTEPRLARSFKLGVIRLTERFVKSDPLSEHDERRLVRHITRELRAYLGQLSGRRVARVIGTSGTILSLGALALAESGRPLPADLRNVRVPAKAIHKLRKRLLGLAQAQRLDVPGLDPRRADLSVAGVVLIDTILELLGAEDITLCDLALREGLVLDYIQRNKVQIAHTDVYPDIRRRSVVELAERCNYVADHARQIGRIALAVFDQTRRVHGFGAREREWLDFASVLHDIGLHISYEGHHKHSQYLIRHGDLRGFSPEEVEVIGLVARYHRRGAPRKSDEDFAALPRERREAVRTLAACLSLAEGLDRSHAQLVRAVRVQHRPTEVLVHVKATGDAELELWAANRHAGPLAKLLGKPVRLVTGPRPAVRRRTAKAPAVRRTRHGAARRRPKAPVTPNLRARNTRETGTR
jgi:exopolyphosphatase/guanosine-5'-triphosphate,3'-diphosphate pyrophosphatase